MRRVPVALALLAVLCVVSYWPVFTQPFIADDYDQIPRASVYGPPSGWPLIAQNPVFRFRFTWFELSYALLRLFGFHALPFYLASIALHVLGTWLVYALGTWRLAGSRLALPAAAFFAIYEGHQEAVMWVSASMELLAFVFGVGAFVLWTRWLEARGWWRYGLALVLFAGALVSKESAAIFAALFALPVIFERRWLRGLAGLIPFATLAGAVVAASLLPSQSNARLGDGSFSLDAPFLLVLANSYWRLLFPVGFLSVAVLLWRRAGMYRRLVLFCLAWMAIALLPYCFLTYMLRVPSRQTYLASLGLAWLVAAGYEVLRVPASRVIVVCCVIAVLALNLGTLWVKKRRQFEERAAPTEALIEVARRATGPVRVLCFPYARVTAEAAAASVGRTIVWDPVPGRTTGCFVPVEQLPTGRSGARRGDLANCGQQVRQLDRFGDIAVHSRGDASFGIAFNGASGKGENGYALPPLAHAPDGRSGLQAVHFGHLDIQNN